MKANDCSDLAYDMQRTATGVCIENINYARHLMES